MTTPKLLQKDADESTPAAPSKAATKRGRKRKLQPIKDDEMAEETQGNNDKVKKEQDQGNNDESKKEREGIEERTDSEKTTNTKKSRTVDDEESNTADDNAIHQQPKKTSNYLPMSRCARCTRDVLFSALPIPDLEQAQQIASTLPNSHDNRGRLRMAALRAAINTRADWIVAVHVANARKLTVQAEEMQRALRDNDCAENNIENVADTNVDNESE